MVSTRKTQSSQHDVRNMVRGALAGLRAHSTPSRRLDSWKVEQSAFQQINRAISIGKKRLTRPAFILFERWVIDTIAEQNRQMARLGTSLTCLGLLPSNVAESALPEEIRRAATNVLRDRESGIDCFLTSHTKFVESFEQGEYGSALQIVQDLAGMQGHSYWSLEAFLVCTYLTKGLEELKRTVALVSADASGLQKFFAYFFGVRIEPAQTSSRFKVNLRKRIDESDLEAGQKTYAKFRLYGELGLEEANVARVLAYEQLTTTIDLYFTLSKVVRLVRSSPGSFSKLTVRAAEEVYAQIPLPSTISPAATSAKRLERLADTVLFELVRPGTADVEHTDRLDGLVIQGLASQLSTQSDGVSAERLSKAQMNFAGIPILSEIEDVTALPALPALLLEVLKRSHDGHVIDGTLKSSLIKQLQNATARDNQLLGNSVAIQAVALASKLHSAGKTLDAVVVLEKAYAEAPNRTVGDAILVMVAHLQFEAHELEACIFTTARAGLLNDRLIALLPLAELFQTSKWASLSKLGPSIYLSICLDLYLRTIDDRKIRTYKRYSVEELMARHGVSAIADLFKSLAAENHDSLLIEYFFYHVCDIYTLELLPGVGRTKRVLETRSQLLKLLATMQTAQELEYLQQGKDVDEDLSVTDGLEVLDDSKVYVDEQSILNSVNMEFAADFQRYLRLVQRGIGLSDSLAAVLQNFSAPTAKTFQIPKNEADDLFGELLTNIREKFLFDPAAGLDIIIGRRIRHGTIASEIRGPLEAEGLIGQRPRAGADYGPPDIAIRLCEVLDTKKRKRIYAAFSRFAEGIDGQIALLRDELFHVTSKNKPRGLFDVQLNAIPFALGRSVAQTCNTIEQFSRECLHLFWFFLSSRVDLLKPAVESDTRKSLSSIFNKFSSELRSLGVDDGSFFATVQHASEEVHRRASTIASWIRVPKVNADVKRYPMRKIVDVAIAVVSGQRPGFKPIVSATVPDDVELDTHGFSIVSDALYIALDNVCQRSGKKVDNNVQVVITFDVSASLLRFSITNELGPGGRTPEKEAKLEEIRAAIGKRAYGESARRDRGSGLSKLAALVMQAPSTSIDFGYIESTQFFLKFELVYVGAPQSQPPRPAGFSGLALAPAFGV